MAGNTNVFLADINKEDLHRKYFKSHFLTPKQVKSLSQCCLLVHAPRGNAAPAAEQEWVSQNREIIPAVV